MTFHADIFFSFLFLSSFHRLCLSVHSFLPRLSPLLLISFVLLLFSDKTSAHARPYISSGVHGSTYRLYDKTTLYPSRCHHQTGWGRDERHERGCRARTWRGSRRQLWTRVRSGSCSVLTLTFTPSLVSSSFPSLFVYPSPWFFLLHSFSYFPSFIYSL